MLIHTKSIHSIFLLIVLQILSLSVIDARPVSAKHLPTSVHIERSNSTNNVQIERSNSTNNVQIERSNSTNKGYSVAAAVSPPALNNSIRHIPREKRQTYPVLPFDLYTMHMPCEFDATQRQIHLPNHCRFVFFQRYVSEGFYRVYQLYRLEGFMFGLYYERLRRFEVDHHVFEYRDTGIV